MDTREVCFERQVDLPFDAAVEHCRTALGREGFGVLTEIDVQQTLKAKLGVDREPFLILGACHPPSAHQVLEAVPATGVLLPCNVAVSVEEGQTVVRAMNPSGVMNLLDNPVVRRVGKSVGRALERVVASLPG